jgi:hypothetical protein
VTAGMGTEMATTHTIEAEIEYRFRFPGLEPGEYEIATLKMEVTYLFTKGRPAFTPRGEYGPIDPPDPAEVSFVSAKMIDDDCMDFPQYKINEIASDWLDTDEGYRMAEDNALEDEYLARADMDYDR